MFRKQLLYLGNDQLTAYQWEHGALSAGHHFANNPEGWEALSRHLGGPKALPVYLLADLIEEDFQRESLPHVLGRSKKAMVQRRLNQFYRDTPYRQAIHQGREEYGRRDDRLLFSALTNAELLKPWVDAILGQKAPLAGIYSPALLSTMLVKKLGLACDHLLLITHQSGGLRQSYFQGNDLKFSRLTPILDHEPAAVAEVVGRETDKTQQFLNSARLLPRGETLRAVVIDSRERLEALVASRDDTPTLAHRFLDVTEAANMLGLKQTAPIALCDLLFLHLLGSRTPASHYALPEQTRYFTLWQARVALYILSLGVLAGALLSAGSNSLDAIGLYLQGQQLAVEARAEAARHPAIVRSIPPTVASPHNMKAAVVIDQMISSNAPVPAELLKIVSQALDRLPQIQINQLNWRVSQTPDANAEPQEPQQPPPSPQPAAGSAEPAPPAALLGIPGKPYQILVLEGEVTPFRQDYRTAMESVSQLAAELGKQPQLQVRIIRQPLDTRLSSRLEGRASGEDAEAHASFALQLIRRP